MKTLGGAAVIFWSAAAALCVGPRAAWEESLLSKADAAWMERAQSGQTERAIHFWEEALSVSKDPAPIYLRLTQAYGRQVRHAPDRKQRQRAADMARKYGELAVHQNPKSALAYAWAGEAWGQWADAHKGWRSIAAVRQSIRYLEKAIELDPRCHYAMMILSSIYRESPAWISKGDDAKALTLAERAVASGPDRAINHLTLARILLKLKRPEEARRELETILKLSPPPEAVPETLADQATARALLQELQ